MIIHSSHPYLFLIFSFSQVKLLKPTLPTRSKLKKYFILSSNILIPAVKDYLYETAFYFFLNGDLADFSTINKDDFEQCSVPQGPDCETLVLIGLFMQALSILRNNCIITA